MNLLVEVVVYQSVFQNFLENSPSTLDLPALETLPTQMGTGR